MAEAQRYGITIEIDDKGTMSVLDSMGKKLGDVSGKASHLEAISQKLTFQNTIQAAQIVGRAFGAVKAGVEGLVGSYGVQLGAETQLDSALRAKGLQVDVLGEQYRELASELQGLTGVGDEQLLPSMARLISTGDVQSSMMRRASLATLDLMRSGKSLETATSMVAKAAAGQTDSLREAGIVIEKTGDKAKDFEAALTAIEGAVGGTSLAFGEAFVGQLDKAKGAIGDTGEKVGEVIATGFTPYLGIITDGVTKVGEFVTAHKADLIMGFGVALDTVGKSATTTLRFFDNLKGNLGELYGEIVSSQANAMADFEESTGIIDSFGRVVERLGKALGGDGGLGQTYQDLAAGLNDNAKEQADFAAKMGIANDGVSKLADSIDEKLDAALDGVAKAASEADGAISGLNDGMSESTARSRAAADALREAGGQMLKAVGHLTKDEVKQKVSELHSALAQLKEQGVSPTGDSMIALGKKFAEAKSQSAQFGIQLDIEANRMAELGAAGKEAGDSLYEAMKKAQQAKRELADESKGKSASDFKEAEVAAMSFYDQMRNASEALKKSRALANDGGELEISAATKKEAGRTLAKLAADAPTSNLQSAITSFEQQIEAGNLAGLREIVDVVRSQGEAYTRIIGQSKAAEQNINLAMALESILARITGEARDGAPSAPGFKAPAREDRVATATERVAAGVSGFSQVQERTNALLGQLGERVSKLAERPVMAYARIMPEDLSAIAAEVGRRIDNDGVRAN